MPDKLFITVEGLSGSGKTAVATALAKKLDALYLKPPLAPLDTIRKEVDDTMDKTSRVLFYLTGISQASALIRKELSTRNVVTDKYIYSTLAFPRSRGIQADTQPFMNILMPDLSFYLEANDDIRMKRIEQREGSTSFREPDMLKREQDIKKEFEKFDLIKIDNNGTIDATVDAILNIIQTKITQ